MADELGAVELCTATSTLQLELGRILVRCAICEGDRALVRSHDAADRLLVAHLIECPGRPDAKDG